jgi:protocatechuate 3,4-dioxygenase beta subunit
MRSLLLVLALPVMLAAQQVNVTLTGRTSQPQPPTQAPDTKPEDRCVIDGQVFSAATGEPVKKANLILRRADVSPSSGNMPTSYSTATDAGGSFAMKDIDPGKYRLSVTRTGFVQGEYGARGPLRQGTTLTLAAGQHLQDVNFRLTPHAVIIGRVVDESGDPVANAQVQAMRYRFYQGKKQLQPFGGGSTNDLGEYRMFGLAPGRYYLSATYREGMMYGPTVDRSANQQPDEDYVPTYYPGTTDPSAAAAQDVAAGAQIGGIDFTLSKAHTVRVRGRVVNPGGSGKRPAMLSLTPRDRIGFFNMNRSISSGTNGAFEIRGIVPGSYSLVASINDGDRSVTVRQPVDVGSSNIENLIVTIQPGMELSGQIRVQGETPINLSDLHLTLRTRDPNGMMVGPMPNGRIKEDGTFTLSNVSADQFNVSFYGIPDGYYVKSIRAGDDDVLATGLDLNRGAPGRIDVILSPNAGQVEGAVQNEKQLPAAGATVVMVPQEKERLDQMSYYKTVTTDQYGRFTVKSVDPGEYKVFAWEDVESGAYMDPEFVKPVEGQAASVTIRESSRESLQLKLIPAEAASASEKGKQVPNN